MGSLPPSDLFKPLEPKSFSEESIRVIEFITDYYKNIEKYPVMSQVDPGYLQKCSPGVAPDQPEPLETILADIERTIMPGITHWQSPNFFAYFQNNVSTAAFLGEMLCSGLNVVPFNWITSPAATELEMIVMDWMGKMLQLPKTFLFSGGTGGGGVIHGTTCEAVLCTLAAARDRALKNIGPGNIDKLVVYVSDQTHSTVQKGAKLVGIPPANLRTIPTYASTGFGLSPIDVRNAMENDLASGLVPLFICATVGTTTGGFVDPLKAIGLVAREFNVWLHVDAAFAGSACICPEFRHYLNGVELADSVSMNPHKWFLAIMDCCCLWLKTPETLIESLSVLPEYLRNKPSESYNVVDYKDWQISLSRRFRALKLWLVLRRYGVSNLMAHIRNDVELAEEFEALVLTDNRLEVVVPRKFSLVCFRMKPKPDQDGSVLNQNLLEAINSTGRAFMTHGVVDGVFMIRCAIGGTLTEKCHIDGLWKLIQEKVDIVVMSC